MCLLRGAANSEPAGWPEGTSDRLSKDSCANAPPEPYGRSVAKKILILWYTAAGTFTWSRDTGCTMAPPKRRLAAPWGPKLS